MTPSTSTDRGIDSKSPVIDFHAHVLPRAWERALPEAIQPGYDQFRRNARFWFKPLGHTLHKAQTFVRHLPEVAQRPLDELMGLAALPGLLVESSPDDLREAMNKNLVDRALLIAHPPVSTNDWILEVAQEDSRFVPVVNIHKGTHKPSQALKDFAGHGARALKIHAPLDGDSPASLRYKALLKSAAELNMPVIVHTGCFHSNVLFKNPQLGAAELFEPWFKEHPRLTFVLAHMNYHAPGVALDLAERYDNVWVDTSWQPSETIGEAVRRIGAERVVFATDWPFMGENLGVGLQRVRDCVTSGMLTEAQSRQVLGLNAARLLDLPLETPAEA